MKVVVLPESSEDGVFEIEFGHRGS
jgi:hypothetical protein